MWNIEITEVPVVLKIQLPSFVAAISLLCSDELLSFCLSTVHLGAKMN